MTCLNVAHRARVRTHHHRLGLGTPAKILNASEQFAARNSGCCETDIVATDQIIGIQYLIEIDAIGYELAPVVVTTTDLEQRLRPLYDKLHLQDGQLEALTGINERRWWEPNFPVSEGAVRAARQFPVDQSLVKRNCV